MELKATNNVVGDCYIGLNDDGSVHVAVKANDPNIVGGSIEIPEMRKVVDGQDRIAAFTVLFPGHQLLDLGGDHWFRGNFKVEDGLVLAMQLGASAVFHCQRNDGTSFYKPMYMNLQDRTFMNLGYYLVGYGEYVAAAFEAVRQSNAAIDQ